MKRSVCLVAALAVLGLSVPPALARNPKVAASQKEQQDQREAQGRGLFARGDYQGALDVYVNLFADTGDPLYLRNIGRCYQKLEQADKAINSFREYLRREHVKPAERSEVEGFIEEMEQLRKRQQAAAATQPPTEATHPAGHPTESASSAMPVPVATDSAGTAPTVSNEAPGAMLSQQASPEASPPHTSITGRWWFWTALAVVVVGGAAGAYAATHTWPGNMPPCSSPAGSVSCGN